MTSVQKQRCILIFIIGFLGMSFRFSNSLENYWKESHPDSEQSATASQVVSSAQEKSDVIKPGLVSRDTPELILVNKSLRLDQTYEPTDLRPIQGIYLREMAAVALSKLLADAQTAGIHGLVPFSGYRSYGTQVAVYSNKIASLRSEYGKNAEEMAEKLVAPPGSSEHQTGLAFDITLKDFLNYEYVLNYDFANTVQGQWLSKNSWKYGFILRYNENKEDKTNFSYEPWHFRYVGIEHAKVIYESDICLEEYLTMFAR